MFFLLSVLDFWEFYGADNIRAYLYDTARAAGKQGVSNRTSPLVLHSYNGSMIRFNIAYYGMYVHIHLHTCVW